MALTTLSYKTDTDVVKTEGPNRISRDEGILASGTSALVSIPGLVVGVVTASGKLAPFNPAASNGTENATAILLETVDASAADKRVVLLSGVGGAEVVLQSLVWPVGITTTQKTAALAALKNRGIVARMGV